MRRWARHNSRSTGKVLPGAAQPFNTMAASPLPATGAGRAAASARCTRAPRRASSARPPVAADSRASSLRGESLPGLKFGPGPAPALAAQRQPRRQSVVIVSSSASAAVLAAAAAPAQPKRFKWGADMKNLGICVVVATAVWLLPAPQGVSAKAWHLLAIFLGTIVGIITKPLPLGAVAMLGLGATMLTKTLTFSAAFSAFASEIPVRLLLPHGMWDRTLQMHKGTSRP